MGKNYYDILQVSKEASPEVIRAAYIALVKKYHPDNFKGDINDANNIVQQLNFIYSILSDPIKKAEYDNMLLKNEINKTKVTYTNNRANNKNSSKENIKKGPNIHPKKPQFEKEAKIGIILTSLLFFSCLSIPVIGMILTLQESNSKKSAEVSVNITETSTTIVDSSFHDIDKSLPLSPLPENGQIVKGSSLLFNSYNDNPDYYSPLTISGDKSQNYYVKLKDSKTLKDSIVFFVRSGQTVNLSIPLGSYRLYYATGSEWYGLKYLFGNNTSYFTSDEILAFRNNGYYVQGHEITLYKTPNGDFNVCSISKDDF